MWGGAVCGEPPALQLSCCIIGGVQLGQLTNQQAAELYGIKPATWRAYTTRQQGPRRNPDGTWNIINLLLWRNIPVPHDLAVAAACQMYRITAYGMAWHTRTRAVLEQCGLDSNQAILFADNTTPRNMTVPQFKELSKVLDYRREYQQQIQYIAPVIDCLTREDIYHVVARKAGTMHPVELFNQLGLLCIARGMDEISPPWGMDKDFFTDSPTRFMRLLERGQFLHSISFEIKQAA